MSLPALPKDWEEGYDWVSKLSGGWSPIASWGSEGWDLGDWPLVIVAHYNGSTFGQAVYVESDITVKEFDTRRDRDKATDATAVFYWKHLDVRGAPRSILDPRLGPYRCR